MGGLLIASLLAVSPALEVERSGSSLPGTVVSVATGATEAQAADQEACPCMHQILCCWEALRDWWFEHGQWPGRPDGESDEGGDADEVLIQTHPTATGDPTEVD